MCHPGWLQADVMVHVSAEIQVSHLGYKTAQFSLDRMTYTCITERLDAYVVRLDAYVRGGSRIGNGGGQDL